MNQRTNRKEREKERKNELYIILSSLNRIEDANVSGNNRPKMLRIFSSLSSIAIIVSLYKQWRRGAKKKPVEIRCVDTSIRETRSAFECKHARARIRNEAKERRCARARDTRRNGTRRNETGRNGKERNGTERNGRKEARGCRGGGSRPVRYETKAIDKRSIVVRFTRLYIGKYARGWLLWARLAHGNGVCRRRFNKGALDATGIDGNSTRVPFIFNLCFKSPSRALATRVDAVFANIDSEKRRTMPLIFCFQCPLCQTRCWTATVCLLSLSLFLILFRSPLSATSLLVSLRYFSLSLSLSLGVARCLASPRLTSSLLAFPRLSSPRVASPRLASPRLKPRPQTESRFRFFIRQTVFLPGFWPILRHAFVFPDTSISVKPSGNRSLGPRERYLYIYIYFLIHTYIPLALIDIARRSYL